MSVLIENYLNFFEILIIYRLFRVYFFTVLVGRYGNPTLLIHTSKNYSIDI